MPWQRVLGADRGDTNIRGFTGFRKSIVAGVEVFPFLMAVFLTVSRDVTLARMMVQRPYVGLDGVLTLNLFWRRSFLLGSLP